MRGRALVTGGAGFIGTNVAERLLASGCEVVVLDDLSRPGVTGNLNRLQGHPSKGLTVEIGDVTDRLTVRRALAGVDRVFHFAAQVAVTSSVTDPMHDFTVNLTGTMNLLEELRRLESPPSLLFTSTNKVYGDLEDVEVRKRGERYEPADRTWRAHGIGEQRPLQFCSPYGCSKGGADQYVLDYAKSYGLRALVFRMSCIYGPHQCGNEDQGWVAHFLMQAMAGEPITLYGDGRQVRDILFVDDLVDAMLLALDDVDRLKGAAFNIGGGPASTVSLLELLDLITGLEEAPPQVGIGPWRVGDQRWYVSDTRRFSAATGWKPRVGVAEGVHRLHTWLSAHHPELRRAERSADLLTVAEAR
ncbi:MAG TPA: NAD-dependent epimerase/dehydratase family protein [Acidimicrobiales bacterium]|nr:NAD-dependent epimerase/dehydratase family protein [Acidimicrobiales bacterium]